MLIFQFVTKDDLFPIIFPGWPYLDTNSLMIFRVLLTVERNDRFYSKVSNECFFGWDFQSLECNDQHS